MENIFGKIIIIVTTLTNSFFGVSASTIPAQVMGTTTSGTTQRFYSQKELLDLAGPLPTKVELGNGKYVTTGAKKGYVYL